MEQDIGREFSGLNRATAAHLLAPGESPANTDFVLASEVHGVGGARLGNKRLTSFKSNIRGVIPFRISGGSGRVGSFDNGTWQTYSTWPNPTANLQGALWDRLRINTALVGGASTSTFGPIDLSQYTNIIMDLSVLPTNIVDPPANNTWQLQGLVGASWTTMGTVQNQSSNSGFTLSFNFATFTGNLTQLRLSGSGASISIRGDIYFIYALQLN